MDYFSEVFEIEYPLPKLDLLAVHEFVSFFFFFFFLDKDLSLEHDLLSYLRPRVLWRIGD